MIHGKLKIRILKLMTPTYFLAFKQLYHFLNWCCRSVGDSGFCFGSPDDIIVVLMILVGKAKRTLLLQTPEQNLGDCVCIGAPPRLPRPASAPAQDGAAGKLYRVRFRLYRNEILQVNMRLKALNEIYTMHSFAPF